MDVVEKTVLVHSASELEVIALVDVLADAGIESKTSIHRDTAYPGIVDALQPPAEIRVALDQAEQARDLINGFLQADPLPANSDNTGPSPQLGAVDGWSYGWILTSLIFVGLLAIVALVTTTFFQ